MKQKNHVEPIKISDPDLLSAIETEKNRGYYSDEVIHYIANKANKLTFNTGEFLCAPHLPCDHHFYIAKGLVRSYFADSDGKEVTQYFCFENMFIINSGSGTREYIQALEDSVVYTITQDEYSAVLETDSDLKAVVGETKDQLLGFERRRSFDILTKDAHTRYAEFLSYYLELGINVSRIKDKHIASYLGISPETLSRIKKQKLT